MSTNSPFISQPEQYQRDINLIRDYINDQAEHLVIMKGISKQEAVAFVKEMVKPGGPMALHYPTAHYLERDLETQDRTEYQGSVADYIDNIIKEEQIFAPTLTTYHHPKVRFSPLSKFQDDNVKSRGKAKKAMFKAEQDEGRTSFNYRYYNGCQTTEKLANNAVSGAMVSKHNPLYNKTGHSSLTSSCRQTSAYGNANNERFLGGNRHYWSYDITRNNIVSIVAHSNYPLIESVMKKYNLHYPTVDETVGVVERSAKLYFRSRSAFASLRELVQHLTPLQRAAYVYTGDLYQLKEFNDAFLRRFIGSLIQRVDVPDSTPDDTIHKWPEDFFNLAKQIQTERARGKSVDKIKKEFPEDYAIIAKQTDNIATALWEYEDVVKAFWATDNVPASIAMFPHSMRRVVLISDTDSTIFTTQDWVKWYCDGYPFDIVQDSVVATMIFLASQSIIHILAKMSANVGIERKYAFQIAMKNEFRFDVLAMTGLGKHYYAQIGCQEGNVLEKLKKEIKGVHLKSSKAPKEAVQQAEDMMLAIMADVRTKQSIDPYKYLKEVADLERSIYQSIKMGEHRYLKLASVKEAGAYKKKEDSTPYKSYVMWNDTFGLKYGQVPPPPYKAIEVSLSLDTKGKVKDWLDGLEDQQLANFLREYMIKYNRATISSMLLPLPIISAYGIPNEIMDAMNVRKIIQKVTAMFYLVLETLGFYFNHTDLEQLAMDYY